MFLACSHACLGAHRRVHHPESATASGEEIALHLLRRLNARPKNNRELFASHRTRVTRLLQAVQRGEGLCVLGAGNCDDLDLPSLARDFGRVCLVDSDGEALERGRVQVAPPMSDRVVAQGGVDLSGYLDQIDAWGEGSLELDSLTVSAPAVARKLAARIGGNFDTVLSSCILSQLAVAFQRTLVLSPLQWAPIVQTLWLTHCLTMVHLLRPGGTGVLLVEGNADPETLLLAFRNHPQLASLVDRASKTEPWPWTLQTDVRLVHALVFRRAEAG
jgi:hypothetical protein